MNNSILNILNIACLISGIPYNPLTAEKVTLLSENGSYAVYRLDIEDSNNYVKLTLFLRNLALGNSCVEIKYIEK